MFSLFLSPASLRRPSTDRRETLPHDRKLGGLDKLSPKIGGGTPSEKNGRPKTSKISADFLPLQSLIANISGTGQDIENRKDMWSRAIPPAFDEKGPANFGPPSTEKSMFGPTKMEFWEDYISALRGCFRFKFLHELETNPGYQAHIPTGTGVPLKNFNRQNLKFGLKFSVWATITNQSISFISGCMAHRKRNSKTNMTDR